MFVGVKLVCVCVCLLLFVCVCVSSRFREKLGVKTVKALKRNNNSVTHAAIDMLCALMCVSTSPQRTSL